MSRVALLATPGRLFIRSRDMPRHAERAAVLFGRIYQVPFVNYMEANRPGLLSPALNTMRTISSPAEPCAGR